MAKHGMLNGATKSGWVLDACHDRVTAGDVVIADFRGTPDQRFEVLEDDGRGMFRVRRPDGSESPMRPSTILTCAKSHARAQGIELAVRAVRYMRENDCDFLTVDNVRDYCQGSASEIEAREALRREMGDEWLAR